MKTYIGTKIIEAEPEKRGEETGFKVRYPDGYVSWSPTQPFEDAYQPTDAMSFGHAVELMKRGERVARKGWNGKGMFIALNFGSHDFGDDPAPELIEGIPSALFNEGDKGTVTRLPSFMMRTASGATLNGWLASQTDMLARDWQLVGE